MNLPEKDHLSKEDVQKWAKNLLIFSIPAILAFLAALQTGGFTFAIGAGYSALLAAGIDLFRKYSAGVDINKIEPVDPIPPNVQQTTEGKPSV